MEWNNLNTRIFTFSVKMTLSTLFLVSEVLLASENSKNSEIETVSSLARVLLDKVQGSLQIQGDFQIQCLVRDKKTQSIGVERCRDVSLKNSRDLWNLKRSILNLDLQEKKVVWRLSHGHPILRTWGRHFRIHGDFLWQGHRLKQIDLVRPASNTVHWVIYLPLEDYLKGVLGSEVPAYWPLEALKAQAVASRTYFLWKQRKSRTYYDVRSDYWDQVFKFSKKVHLKINEAVDSSRGLVLVHKKENTIFPAYFHADCGGHTSTEEVVWNHSNPQNTAVADPHCLPAKRNKWSWLLKKSNLMSALNKRGPLPSTAQTLGVYPRFIGQERAATVDVLLNFNLLKRMNANEFRKEFGFGKIKSTNFSVENRETHFVLRGQGYGHGVGLCQWGAKRWAKKNKSFRQILNHYYPNGRIVFQDEKERSLAEAQQNQ